MDRKRMEMVEAKLERLLAGEQEREAEDGDFDSQDLDMACGDAYRKGDLITIATRDRLLAEAGAAERERCAKMCDRIAGNTKDFAADTRRAAGMCAAAIRGQS